MARRPPPARPANFPVDPSVATPTPVRSPWVWTSGRRVAAVGTLLLLHYALAANSLVRENPTIDEVVHLPAGLSYWQTGQFRMYPHNPPLIKLVAALPLLSAGVNSAPLYQSPSWTAEPPNKAGFAHLFAQLEPGRYFELFTRARLLIPLFSIVGALTVYAWSRRLFGEGAGLFSLALYATCPNILAHARLVTTDAGATALGVAATYLFWSYLHDPTWRRATIAGLVLGLAQLSKFSMILLLGLWPALWLARTVAGRRVPGLGRRVFRAVGHGAWILTLMVLLIDVGYGFEGVGRPLGRFTFTSSTLTKVRDRPAFRSPRPDPLDLFGRIDEYRVNRFRGTILEWMPSPLPEHYLIGFDQQKLEADGVPSRYLIKPVEAGDRMGTEGEALQGYPVFLDGVLRQQSWWYFYWDALRYKVAEGTWALAVLAILLAGLTRQARASWADELAVLAVPAVVLGVMSFLTNINLGLRYVLPIFPYLYIALGRVVPWAAGSGRAARALVGILAVATFAATAAIHPHYLAYFNWASGGPSRGSEHLIDSSLDWGQDLVGLRRWVDANAPGEPIGLAYFGQIHPAIFAARGEAFDWFLPPPLPGTMGPPIPPQLVGPDGPTPPAPGLYAVSASLMRGLPWRVYDPGRYPPYEARRDAFAYFAGLRPIGHVGHSIFLYRITPEDARGLARLWIGDGAD